MEVWPTHNTPILMAIPTPIFSFVFNCRPQRIFHGTMANAISAPAHHAALKMPYRMLTPGSQHVPSINGFHAFAIGAHCTHASVALGIMMKNNVMMQNQTKVRRSPLVSRRRVMPKLILENVDAKQDREATAVEPSAMVGRLVRGMSRVCLPNPRCTPIWVVIASARRRIWWVVLVRIYGIVGSSFGGIIVPCERREEEQRLYIATERMSEKFRNCFWADVVEMALVLQ
jgi:hypothetical protein